MTMTNSIVATVLLVGCSDTEKQQASVDTGFIQPLRCPEDVPHNIAAGGAVYVADTIELTATFHGGNAAHSSILSMSHPDEIHIGQLHTTAEGESVSLGTFGKGQELIFSLEVPQADKLWYSGDPARNSDGLGHARIVQA